MNRDSHRRHARALFCSAAVAGLAIAWPSHAHITLHPDTAPAGTYFQTAFIVPHGCAGSPTVALNATIPDGITSVKPQMKPGWKVSLTYRQIDPPVESESGTMTDRVVASVQWRGGPLPDELYDSFGLVMKLPAAAGKTLYFPVEQICENGRRAWTHIPAEGQAWHAVREPAPYIRLQPAH